MPFNGNGKLPQISPVFVDDANNLDPFFAALWKLEQGKLDQGQAVVVTILHYGDSPTTADLITGDVRAQLQQRFGDAGRGYTLIAKPWAWYGHRGVEISDHGWKMRTGVGLMREGIYGLGGAAFEGQPGAWSKFRLTESQQSAVEVEYLAKPGGGAFAVEADDAQVVGAAHHLRDPGSRVAPCVASHWNQGRHHPAHLGKRHLIWSRFSPRIRRPALR